MRGAGKRGNVQTLVATMPACYTSAWWERGGRGGVPDEQMGTPQPPRAPILKAAEERERDELLAPKDGSHCVHVPLINRSIHTGHKV